MSKTLEFITKALHGYPNFMYLNFKHLDFNSITIGEEGSKYNLLKETNGVIIGKSCESIDFNIFNDTPVKTLIFLGNPCIGRTDKCFKIISNKESSMDKLEELYPNCHGELFEDPMDYLDNNTRVIIAENTQPSEVRAINNKTY